MLERRIGRVEAAAEPRRKKECFQFTKASDGVELYCLLNDEDCDGFTYLDFARE